MAVRDRVVVGVLAAGFLLSLAVWHSPLRWAAVVVLLVAVLAAAVTYRVERRPPALLDERTAPAERVGDRQ